MNMTKRKSGRSSSRSFGEAVGFRNKIENDTIDFFLGLVLLAFSVLLIISMVSYLSTGKADQSILKISGLGNCLTADTSLPTIAAL